MTKPRAAAFMGQGLIIIIQPSVLQLWSRYRQTEDHATEACGILIASRDMDDTRIWIEAATPPGERDKRSRTTFHMKDESHQQAVDQAFKESQGVRHLLGTWHTHPEANPAPSRKDTKGWRAFAKANKGLPGMCFAIIGTEEIALYADGRKGFTRLDPM